MLSAFQTVALGQVTWEEKHLPKLHVTDLSYTLQVRCVILWI